MEFNVVIIFCLLFVCGNIVVLMYGKVVYCFFLRRGMVNDVFVGSVLIDMYVKCGKIRDFRLCFDAMFIRNIVIWNVIIGGYVMYGKNEEVIEMFEWM